MESGPIRLKTLTAATAIVVALEMAAIMISAQTATQAMATTGIVRCMAILVLLFLTWKIQGSLGPIGLAPETVRPGLKRGMIWSLVFGGLVAVGFGGLYLAGINPFGLFKTSLPETTSAVFLFFVVGGLLAPVAEEIFFRGLVYGYLRRWGPVVAILGSTIAFVAVHPNLQQLPLVQVVGGVLFAVAYEVEKKLIVPIVIHSTGNLALFSLSLIG